MKINSLLIIASFPFPLISFSNRDDLPGNIDYVPSIANEPVQVKTSKRGFDICFLMYSAGWVILPLQATF